jgi:hypothetical protein
MHDSEGVRLHSTNVEGMDDGSAMEIEDFGFFGAKSKDQTETRHGLHALDLRWVAAWWWARIQAGDDL